MSGSEETRGNARSLEGVLRVLIRHPNLFQRQAFEDLAAAIGREAAFDRLVVLVPDSGRYRVFAVSSGPEVVPFGSLVDPPQSLMQRAMQQREPAFCDDMLEGTDLERLTVEMTGLRSYVIVPICAGPERHPVAALTLAFRGVATARGAPLGYLEAVADLVGSSFDTALRLARDRRLAMILETSWDAMVAWDVEGRVTDANPAALALTGRTREELVGTPIEDLFPPGADGKGLRELGPPDGARGATGRGSSPGAEGVRVELLARRGDEAARVTVAATITAVDDDALVAAHALLRDLSQVIAAEEAERNARTRLVQNDRLATLGTLVAGVAHEINNPAAFVLLGLDMLDRRLSWSELGPEVASGARELLGELRDSTRRIVDIVRDLRMFAGARGQTDGRPLVVDVNRTVESALALTRGQILEKAEIVLRLGDVPAVLLSDGRLGQVLVNLLVNAAQAIARTGSVRHRVTIETRRDDDAVEIEVSDTGVGIPTEDMPRIWQPFFTTKPDVGTGLGLSISREIVERAGGRMWAESPIEGPGHDGTDAGPVSAPSRGARFVVRLPLSGAAPALCAPLQVGPATRSRRGGRVLVVDDEASLARALSDALRAEHEVVAVNDAESADALLLRERFGVVLCDLRMPGLSGESLFRRVEQRDPAQARAFVFMTGVGFGADVERFLAAAGRPVLEKPFSAAAAFDVIALVLRAGETQPPRSPPAPRSPGEPDVSR
jgi:signal transduction histidine kinase/ActR/RegA family two-component response regulator